MSTIELLSEVAEFLDNQSDVEDGPYGKPKPNKAMRLLGDVEAEIARLRKAAEADRFARDLSQALNEGDGSYKP